MAGPGPVAWSNAIPPGMQTVEGLILGSETFFFADWSGSGNNFYGHSLPTADSSRAVASDWQKNVHLALVTHLGSLPRNSVVRLTDRLNMTTVVDWDMKPQIKQNKNLDDNII